MVSRASTSMKFNINSVAIFYNLTINTMIGDKVLVLFAAVALCQGATLGKSRLGIEGGDFAVDGQFPYQASIQSCTLLVCHHVCGAVILNRNWVLTSASCLDDADKVLAGAAYLQDWSRETQNIKVDRTVPHPRYTVSTGPNDIALVRVRTPFKFNSKVQPIRLPAQDQSVNGTADLTGYGTTFLPDRNRLKVVSDLEIINNEECEELVSNLVGSDENIDNDSNICTLGSTSNTCDGDIGSPLVQDGVVIGTATWYLDPCGFDGAPNVYTNVLTSLIGLSLLSETNLNVNLFLN